VADPFLKNHMAPASSLDTGRELTLHHITLRPNLPDDDESHPVMRICARGADALCDSEMLALVLRPRFGEDALPYARHLLATHGSLRALRRAAELPPAAHTRIDDEELRATLLAVFTLAERSTGGDLAEGAHYSSSHDTRRYFELRIGRKDTEVFAALFLDTRHRLIEFRELFFGTVSSTHVYAREVLRTAMSLNASALVFCHNHPSGDVRPSDADIEITRSLKRLLDLVDVRVLDHIVVTDSDSVSMMELGLI